jgi:hypothetical protein
MVDKDVIDFETALDYIEQLEAENKRLKEALGVYADESNWYSVYGGEEENLFLYFGGHGFQYAHEALKGNE